MCKHIDEIQIPSLALYLSTRYTSVNNYIICDAVKNVKINRHILLINVDVILCQQMKFFNLNSNI